ncbi:MAG: hypothetical protein ACI4R9_04320 [Kiritimatiellia bacterium]
MNVGMKRWAAMKKLVALALAAQCASWASAVERFTVPDDFCAWQFEAGDAEPDEYHTVVIPKNFTKPWPVGNAFAYDLEAFEVEPGNPCYKAVDGVLYYKEVADEGWTLVQFPAGKTGSFRIPDDVWCVGESAFECCRLSKLTIGPNLREFLGNSWVGNEEDEEYAPELTINVENNSRFVVKDDILYRKLENGKWKTALIGGKGGKPKNEYVFPRELAEDAVMGLNVAYRHVYVSDELELPLCSYLANGQVLDFSKVGKLTFYSAESDDLECWVEERNEMMCTDPKPETFSIIGSGKVKVYLPEDTVFKNVFICDYEDDDDDYYQLDIYWPTKKSYADAFALCSEVKSSIPVTIHIPASNNAYWPARIGKITIERDYSGPAGGSASAIPAAWKKARTITAVAFDGNGDVFGTVNVKCGKANQKTGKASVSMIASPLSGKKKTYKAQTVQVGEECVEVGWDDAFVCVSTWSEDGKDVTACEGGFNWNIDGEDVDIEFYTDCTIGGALTQEAVFDFGELVDLDAFGDNAVLASAETASGETVSPYAELGFAMAGKKWTFDKPASVRWKKAPKGSEVLGTWLIDTSKDKTNIPGLKLTYNTKTGLFKGSFKVYTESGKKYTANVSGIIVDGIGYGKATIKKPAATWSITIDTMVPNGCDSADCSDID